jgi:hypothetical protein
MSTNDDIMWFKVRVSNYITEEKRAESYSTAFSELHSKNIDIKESVDHYNNILEESNCKDDFISKLQTNEEISRNLLIELLRDNLMKINEEIVIDFERLKKMDPFNRKLLFFKLLIQDTNRTKDKNLEKLTQYLELSGCERLRFESKKSEAISTFKKFIQKFAGDREFNIDYDSLLHKERDRIFEFKTYCGESDAKKKQVAWKFVKEKTPKGHEYEQNLIHLLNLFEFAFHSLGKMVFQTLNSNSGISQQNLNDSNNQGLTPPGTLQDQSVNRNFDLNTSLKEELQNIIAEYDRWENIDVDSDRWNYVVRGEPSQQESNFINELKSKVGKVVTFNSKSHWLCHWKKHWKTNNLNKLNNPNDYLKKANEIIEEGNINHKIQPLQYGGGNRVLFHFEQTTMNIVVIIMLSDYNAILATYIPKK